MREAGKSHQGSSRSRVIRVCGTWNSNRLVILMRKNGEPALDGPQTRSAGCIGSSSTAKSGCQGLTWGALNKVVHSLSLPGYTDLIIHCER